MWGDYRGSLSTVYNDREISTCGEIIGVHSVQSTVMGDLNMWGDYGGSLSTVYNDGEISTCGETIEVHSVQSTMMGRCQHVGRV